MAATIAGGKALTIRLGLLPAVLLILAVSAAAIDPPVWPDAYEVSQRLARLARQTIVGQPCSSQVALAPAGLICAVVGWVAYTLYPVHVWYDNPGKQMRVAFYNGLDETYVMPVSMAGIAREHLLHCPPCMTEYHCNNDYVSAALA
ncbi:hypothetical protein HaLaN_13242 [Haematococcus lacustris]|uniref:Uncharacterized protein n=1 Tax=Haematococcus lacustris TaxID=44745 RepID=A0A699Z5B7_HAELA|nr:hypothetical protein HaLaN_13242 [Haematococcus lacustris]